MFVLQSGGHGALPRRGVHICVYGDIDWEETASSTNLYWSIRRICTNLAQDIYKLSNCSLQGQCVSEQLLTVVRVSLIIDSASHMTSEMEWLCVYASMIKSLVKTNIALGSYNRFISKACEEEANYTNNS